MTQPLTLRVFMLLVFLIYVAERTVWTSPAVAQHGVKVSECNYRGWKKSYRISNGQVEVIIAPEVGRVMQFHYTGEREIFWENPAMYGKAPDSNASDWENFGGDKTWPAPQSSWKKMTGRSWPPPTTFDSVPLQASTNGNTVELTSRVDPTYGVKFRRVIELDALKPQMKITTIYEKVTGKPVTIGIGGITQLRDPERVFIVLPTKSRFANGYTLQQFEVPEELKVSGRLLSLKRGREAQIGSDGEMLIWMDDAFALRIRSQRVPGAKYDGDANSTVYTSPDPLKYVELEPFGPLRTLKAGDRIESEVTYTLSRRKRKDAQAEAEILMEKDGR